MRLPLPRGPLSRDLGAVLAGAVANDHDLALPDGRTAEDDALSLWILYELHYRGFDEVDDRWEWAPALMAVRRVLEDDLESRLRERHRAATTPAGLDDLDVAAALRALVDADDGPSLARHLQRGGSRQQALATLRQRSLYHLKEADPTSWVVPRLSARPKAALLEVQFDEYGGGEPRRLHHHLFELGLEASGLSGSYGAYVDEANHPVLEQNNTLSMFGLQRRLRGAALGHLAAFEATSAVPSRQLAQGLRRLGFPDEMAAYYEEHMEADAVHEQLAARDVCGALVDEEPALRDDVLFGAWTCLDLEARMAATMLASWEAA